MADCLWDENSYSICSTPNELTKDVGDGCLLIKVPYLLYLLRYGWSVCSSIMPGFAIFSIFGICFIYLFTRALGSI